MRKYELNMQIYNAVRFKLNVTAQQVRMSIAVVKVINAIIAYSYVIN